MKKLFLSILLLILLPSLGWGAVYYVDQTGGLNTNDGLSTGAAWKTISKVNGSSFSAGDNILFKRGETWREQLTVPSSGSSGSPITFGAYGSGNKPVITGADLVNTWTLYAPIDTFDTDFSGWTANNATRSDTEAFGGTGYSLRCLNGQTPTKSRTETATFSIQFEMYDEADDFTSNGKNGPILIPRGTTTAEHFRLFLRNVSGSRYLRVEPNGTANFTATTGSNAISQGAWHKIKLTATINGTAGRIQVWVDDAVDIDVSGNTYNSTGGNNASIVSTQFFCAGWDWGANGVFYFDSVQYYPGSDIYATSYSATVTTSPNYVLKGSSSLTKGSSAIALTDQQWFWAANVLYFRDDSGTPSNMEASVRDYAITSSAKNYITIDSLGLKNVNATLVNGSGAHAGVTVTNCTMNYGITSGVKIYASAAALSAINISSNIMSNITGDSIDVQAVSGGTLAGLTINSNTITGITTGAGSGMYISGVSGGVNSISSNTMAIFAKAAIWMQAWSGGTNTIAYNTVTGDSQAVNDFAGIHPILCSGGTYIFEYNTLHDNVGNGQNAALYMDTFSGSTVTIRYNYVYNYKGPGISITKSSGILAYYNLFVETALAATPAGPSGSIEISTGANVNSNSNIFYNNTIYNNSANDGHAVLIVSYGGSGDCEGNIFKNNIISHQRNSGQEWIKNSIDSTAVFDYNIFWPATAWNSLEWNGSWYNFADWKTNTSQDAHSYQANPLFVSATDFHLQSGSPAINAGVDVGLTQDYEGKSVPKGPKPDMGAYEFYPRNKPSGLNFWGKGLRAK